MSYDDSVLNTAEVRFIKEKLTERFDRSAQTLAESSNELAALGDVIARIDILRDQMSEAKMRLVRIGRMLGDKRSKALLQANAHLSDADRKELHSATKYSRSDAVSVRSFMDEYLSMVKEAKVAEIVAFLRAVGLDYAKRQTVENALKNHLDEFKVPKRGREKFVSLAPGEW